MAGSAIFDPQAFAREWIEGVWAANIDRSLARDLINKLVAPEARFHGLDLDAQGMQIIGPDGYLGYWLRSKEMSPDISCRVTEVLWDAASRKLCICYSCSGNASGDRSFLGRPSNKPFTITGMCLTTLEQGRIVEERNSEDPVFVLLTLLLPQSVTALNTPP